MLNHKEMDPSCKLDVILSYRNNPNVVPGALFGLSVLEKQASKVHNGYSKSLGMIFINQ